MASSVGTSHVGRHRNIPQTPHKVQPTPAFSKLLRAVKDGIRCLRPHSRAERWLFVSLASFVLLEGCFFWLAWRGHEYHALRYALIAGNVPLILVIPEITRKQKRWVRISLLLVPALGAAFLQARVEDLIIRISEQRNSIVFNGMREAAIQYREKELNDYVVPVPNSIIQDGQRAEKAFIMKANRLHVAVFSEEARLLVDQPELAPRILTFSENSRARLNDYEQLARANPRLQAIIAPVLGTLRSETAYLDLADYFRAKIMPAYQRLEYKIDHKALLTTEACAQILHIMNSLRDLAVVNPVAGLYNHIGNLALNCGQPELALASFYEALVIDSTHVTVYESLSYALWIFNNDSKNALHYADLGLRTCQTDRDGVQADFHTGQQLYDSFSLNNRRYSPLVARHVKALERRIAAIQNDWANFMDRKTHHFQNDFAYYSALRMENEKEAKGYIDALYKGAPDDSDIEDTTGFVYMRFAMREEDLNRAEQLFISAIKNPEASPETSRWANAHLQELDAYKAALRGRDESEYLDRLVSTLSNDDRSMLAKTQGGTLARN